MSKLQQAPDLTSPPTKAHRLSLTQSTALIVGRESFSRVKYLWAALATVPPGTKWAKLGSLQICQD